jgi:hypothetical protein
VEEKEEEEDRKIMTKGERGMGWLELKERKEWLARPMLVLKIGRGDDLISDRLGRSKHQSSDMLSLFPFFFIYRSFPALYSSPMFPLLFLPLPFYLLYIHPLISLSSFHPSIHPSIHL